MPEQEKILSLYCFLDTNILMEFQTFDEVEWEKVLSAKQVCLVLAPVVLSELDKHKGDFNNTRRQKRARMILPKINHLLESETAQDILPKVRRYVTLLVLSHEPFIDWKQEHLDPTINDDRLLASILDFRSQHQGEHIFLLSDDSGPRLKAKSRQIYAIKPPDGLRRLPDPPSPEVLQIRQLQKQLEALTNQQPSLLDQVQMAITAQRSEQTALLRKYMEDLATSIETLSPTFTHENQSQWDELFDQAIEHVLPFSNLAASIAELNAREAALALYKGFEHIRNLYTFPQTGAIARPSLTPKHDIAKFLGHELFVTFFAFLLREERWSLIANLLQETIYTREYDFGDAMPLTFSCIEKSVDFLSDRNKRLQTRFFSPQGDVLNKRHTTGKLAEAVPMHEFVDADYLLFLRSQLETLEESPSILWVPWSFIYMKEIPRYLKEARSKSFAQKLALPLGVSDAETLRNRCISRAHKLVNLWHGMFLHDPLERFDFATIGTR